MQQKEYEAMYRAEDSHWWFVARRRFIEVFLGKPQQKKLRIADIGAGTGGTTAWLGRYGRVIGVEPSPYGRYWAQKRGVKLRIGTAAKTNLASNSFDMVTILDVLYHKNVFDDLVALKEAHRILRPEGTLLVTVCAFEWLGGRHQKAVHGKHRYTLGEMIRKIQRAGFLTQRASYTFFLSFPLLVSSRLWERVMVKNRNTSALRPVLGIASILLVSVGVLEAFFLRFISFPFG